MEVLAILFEGVNLSPDFDHTIYTIVITGLFVSYSCDRYAEYIGSKKRKSKYRKSRIYLAIGFLTLCNLFLGAYDSYVTALFVALISFIESVDLYLDYEESK